MSVPSKRFPVAAVAAGVAVAVFAALYFGDWWALSIGGILPIILLRGKS